MEFSKASSSALTSGAEGGRNRKRRSSYCHRNPKLAQGALKYPYGVSHVISTVYHDGLPSHHYQEEHLPKEDENGTDASHPANLKNARQSQCHLILLSFWERSDAINDWIESFIHKENLVHREPIILLQLSLSNPHSNLTLHSMQRKLTSLYSRRAQSCYFFVILVPPQNKQLQTPIPQQSIIPLQIYDLFRTSLGAAWFSSSYFLVANLMSSSILDGEGWHKFKNKLELICVQIDYKETHQSNPRLILQTVCSSCNDPLTTVLISGIDPYTGRVQQLSPQLFPNFMSRGFDAVWVERSLRFQMPASVERTKKSLDHILPKYLLYNEMKKAFGFSPTRVVNAWVNGYKRSGLRDYVKEIENGGPLALGHHFTPLETKSTKIGFTFPYMENRLGMLTKRMKALSKWQILFEEVQNTLIPIAIPSICLASFILTFRTLNFKNLHDHHLYGRHRIYTKNPFFLSVYLDWVFNLVSIFYSQLSLANLRNQRITPLPYLILFLVSLPGTLYMGLVRVRIATDLTTEAKGQEIKSIFQLDPSKASSKQELWGGGRLETNAEISRLLPFQNAQQAEHEQEVLVNLKYFYDPIACINSILQKEKYVCIAFEEYIQLVIPTLPADIRKQLAVKSVTDLGTSEWLSVAYNKDFPWAHELTMFVLHVVESGIFDFWIRNLSLAIPEANPNAEDGFDEKGGEGDRQDFDSYEVQHEGLMRFGENFGMGVVLIVIAFLVEFAGFTVIKIMRERGVVGKMRNGFGRIYHRIMDRLRGITRLDFVP
ncbi:unnamed protein product [Orchesella dallaii]|uniref:Uncharacterized protein n=1 Tax=Orchesella dallaii TaxID=48710 RepID=A0ABP1Q9K4_9HEXA